MYKLQSGVRITGKHYKKKSVSQTMQQRYLKNKNKSSSLYFLVKNNHEMSKNLIACG